MNEKRKQCFDFDDSFIEPNWDLRNCFVEKNKTSTSFCELLKENNKYLTLSTLSVLLFQHNQILIKEKNNLQNRIDKAIEYLYEHSQYNDRDGVHYIKEDEYCVDYLLDILKESGE